MSGELSDKEGEMSGRVANWRWGKCQRRNCQNGRMFGENPGMKMLRGIVPGWDIWDKLYSGECLEESVWVGMSGANVRWRTTWAMYGSPCRITCSSYDSCHPVNSQAQISTPTGWPAILKMPKDQNQTKSHSTSVTKANFRELCSYKLTLQHPQKNLQ